MNLLSHLLASLVTYQNELIFDHFIAYSFLTKKVYPFLLKTIIYCKIIFYFCEIELVRTPLKLALPLYSLDRYYLIKIQ